MAGCPGGMGMMGAGLLLFVLLLVAVGFVAYRLGQNRSNGTTRTAGAAHGEGALDVVRRRYAEGKIDRDEFERLRRDLA